MIHGHHLYIQLALFNRTNKCSNQQILECATGRKYDKQSIPACTSMLQSMQQTCPHTTFKCPCTSVHVQCTSLVHGTHTNTFLHHRNNHCVNKHSIKCTIRDTNNRTTKKWCDRIPDWTICIPVAPLLQSIHHTCPHIMSTCIHTPVPQTTRVWTVTNRDNNVGEILKWHR